MRRIGPAPITIREIPGDCEVVVLHLTTMEHDELHGGPKEFVNKNKVFAKSVSDVVLHPKSHATQATAPPAAGGNVLAAETWMCVIIHRPACTCAGTCTPL